MPNKTLTRLILLLIIEVLVVVLVFSAINFFILSRNSSIRMFDWFLLEGIFCIIVSMLFAIGRGGLDAYTLRSAATVAAADALYDEEHKVSDVFQKDKWKPSGFPKAALVLLIVGVIFLLIYFLTL